MRDSTKKGSSLLIVVALSCAAFLGCQKSRSTEEVPGAYDEARKEIEQTVSKPASVSYAKDGAQETVTVSLRGANAKDALDAKPKIVPIVKKHFPGATRLDVRPVE